MTSAPTQPAAPTPAATSGDESLTHHAARGVAWNLVMSVAERLLSVGMQIALTYVLLKEDFGVWALAMPMVNLVTIMQYSGVREILMRRRKRIHLWINPAVWMSGAIGLLGAAVMLGAAVPMARIYENPELGVVVALLAITPLARAMAIVPDALMFDALRFRATATMFALGSMAANFLYMVFALLGMGARSFPLALPLPEAVRAAIIWRMMKPRVKRSPELRRWRYMVGDSALVFGSNLAKWARGYGDYFVLGLFATEGMVGVYFFAFSLSIQTFRMVTLNLASVLLPTLSRLRDEPERQVSAFLRAARAMMFIGTPMCLGLGAVAGPFMRGFLDAQKWAALPVILQVISFGTCLRLLDEPAQSLMNAQGRFRGFFRFSLVSAAAFIAAALAGAWAGDRFPAVGPALGTAIAAAAYSLVAGPLLVWVAICRGGGRPVDVARVFIVPIVLLIVSAAPGVVLERLLPAGGRVRELAALAGIVALTGVLYAALATVLRLSEWRELLMRAHALAPGRARPILAPFLRLAGVHPDP